MCCLANFRRLLHPRPAAALLRLYCVLIVSWFPTGGISAQLGSRTPLDTLLHYAAATDDSVAIQANYYLSYRYWNGDLDTAWMYQQAMLQRARSSNRPYDVARAYHARGVVYTNRGQADSAMAAYLTSLDLLDRLDRPYYQRHLYNSMAATYQELGDLESAERSYRLALERAGTRASAGFRASVAYNISNLFIERNQLDSARVYLEPLLRQVETEDRLRIYRPYVLANLGRIAQLEGRYGAAIDYLEAAAAAEAQPLGLIITQLNLAEPLIKTRQYVRAQRILMTALNSARTNGYPDQVRNAYETMTVLDSARGNYAGALNHYRRFVDLRDSLQSAERLAAIDELEIAYKSAARKRDLAELAAAEARATARADRRTLQLFWAIGGLLLLIVPAIVVYRFGQRQGQLVREKELLIQEIDHRNRNHLGIITGLLQLQIDEAEGESSRRAILVTQRRVESISLIHHHLRRRERTKEVAMHEYLPRLMSLLLDHYPGVDYEAEVDTCYLHVDQAVIIGLIVNELVTNSLKYADESGNDLLWIELRSRRKETTTVLEYKDNGPGYPEAVIRNEKERNGLHIVQNLSRQVGGKTTLLNRGGAVAQIDFPL